MGIYMTATAVIGVKFTVDEPVESTSHKRGCAHPPVEGMNFCGECGAPLWKDNTTYEEQFEDLYEEFVEPVEEQINNLFDGNGIVQPDYEGNTFYIGYGITVDEGEEEKISAINPEFIEDDLKAVLTEFGVWEQCKDSFGFWAISTGS